MRELVVPTVPGLTLRFPNSPDDDYTEAGQAEQVRQTLLGYEAGAVVPWVIRQHGQIVGDISLFLINLGPLQSATVGYWVAAAAQGQGIATAAIMTILAVARDELRLHRLEVGASPDNPASVRVLEKAGFTLIGLAPRYLLVGSTWRDQLLYQRLLGDTPTG